MRTAVASLFLPLALAFGQQVTYSSKGSNVTYPVTLNGINLLEATAEQLSSALSNGTISTLQLVDAYIARIEANDHQGLTLNSIIEVAPTAREVAKQLDNERKKRDYFNTDPSLGMNTTAGSYALLGQTVVGDAFVIDKLRAAGAFILAKANLHEFAGERGISKSSAWSARGGQCSAAYVFGGFAAGGDPSGSSSGSAVSVSAGFAALSLGTDTEGSIIGPANRAALFGLRPSTGLTSRQGVVPISSSQDTTGPLAKSVWDIATTLSIMAADDPNDAYSAAANPFRHTDYTQFLDAKGLQGLRIGIPRDPFWDATWTGVGDEVAPAIEATFAKLEALGATIVDPAPFPNAEDYKYYFPGQAERTNNATLRLQYDLRADMATYLQTQLVNSTITTLADIINFNDKNSALEMPPTECCQATFIGADQTGDRDTSAEYWLSKYYMDELYQNGIVAAMRLYDLDLLLVPSEAYSSRLGAIGRLAVGTVPVGYSDINLPFGMAFVGKRFDEPTVLKAMFAYEKNFAARKVPPTLE